MFQQVFNNFENFFFVFIRVSAIFIMIPYLGGRSVPMQVKLGITILLALIITPTLVVAAPMPETVVGLAVAILTEVIIGITIGLTAKFVFSSFEMAGQIAGMQMGFSMANVMDPQTSSQLSVLAQFYNLFGIFLFFVFNIHLVFISAIKETFDVIPPYGFALSGSLFEGMLSISSQLFIVALKLSAPIMVAVLLGNLAMGIIARTVPQLNVFVVGFPVNITIGLVVLSVSLPFISSTMATVYMELGNNIIDLIRVSAG